MTSFIVPYRILRAVAAFASADQARYMLCGVHVEVTPTLVLLVATDGRRMIALDIAKHRGSIQSCSTPETFTIGTRQLNAWADFENKNVLVTHESGVVRIQPDSVDKSITVVNAALFGDYPKWRNAVPNPDAAPMPFVVLNPRLLESFSELSGSVIITQSKLAGYETECYLVRDAARPDAYFGALMPIRVTNPYERPALPYWCAKQDAAPVAEPMKPNYIIT